MLSPQKDMRSEPVQRIVTMGDSITRGYSVRGKRLCWVNRTVQMLEEFQGSEIELINQGIGGNVLTPLCPAYPVSGGKCALERVQGDLIALNPDMVFLAYGLNDSRGGTEPETFRREYQKLIDTIRAQIDPTIVVLSLYYMHEVGYAAHEDWGNCDYDVTDVFNLVIRQLAEKNDLIYADVYSAQAGVDWFVDADHIHPNELGHAVIGNRVFEAIARNCSFTAAAMPEESMSGHFGSTFGGGPDKPSMT